MNAYREAVDLPDDPLIPLTWGAYVADDVLFVCAIAVALCFALALVGVEGSP